MVLLLILGCLERTEEGTRPLDERFSVLPEGVGAEVGSAGMALPFADHTGDKVLLSGVVTAEGADPVDLDFRAPSSEEESGMVSLGKLTLGAPGPWELEVPVSFGELKIEAFQDVGNNGPTVEDPYAWLSVDVAEDPVAEINLDLEVGALARARAEASAGSDPFADHTGKWVVVSGILQATADYPIQLDVRSMETLAVLGKWAASQPGEFSMKVPANLGALQFQVFQDVDDDGPSDADPFGVAEVEVGASDVSFGTLALVKGGKLLLAEQMGHTEQGEKGGEVFPFADHDGPWTQINAVVTSDQGGSVTVDLRVPDASKPGGNRRLGGVTWEGPGQRKLDVPAGLGVLILEAYQDPGADGPSDLDPYFMGEVVVGTEPLSLEVPLLAGTRGQPGMGAQSGGGGSVFAGVGKDGIQISGEIRLEEGLELGGLLDLDVFSSDAEAPGGRRYLWKLKVPPGPFSFRVPRTVSALELEAFLDSDADGPTPGDAFGACTCNPLKLDGTDVSGIEVLVVAGN